MRNILVYNSDRQLYRRLTITGRRYIVLGSIQDSGSSNNLTGACPGFEDCQGFVPPCENCDDPEVWRPIAQSRLDSCYENHSICPRIILKN